jgi:hypothetical protein
MLQASATGASYGRERRQTHKHRPALPLPVLLVSLVVR